MSVSWNVISTILRMYVWGKAWWAEGYTLGPEMRTLHVAHGIDSIGGETSSKVCQVPSEMVRARAVSVMSNQDK